MKYGDLRFYDKDFSLLAVLPRCVSVNWRLNFCGYGTAEIYLEKTEDIVRLLTENEYLFVTQGELQAVITGIKIDTECVIFAKTPEWLLTKFLVCDFSAEDFTSKQISASALACMAVDAALSDKVTLNTEPDETDESDKSKFTKEGAVSVHEIITELLKGENMGFSFKFNASDKSFTFKTLKSKKNETAVISEEYKTSYDESFTMDLQNEATGGVFYHTPVYCGEWDASSNKPALREIASNFGNYYTVTVSGRQFGIVFTAGEIIICKDKSGAFSRDSEAKPFPVKIPPEDKGIFSWSKGFNNKTENEATEELKNSKREESTSFKTKNLVFGKDFSLGDILKTSFSKDGFCVTCEKIVSSIHLWDEAGDSGCLPTLEKIS